MSCIKDRFEQKINKSDGCWEWTASRFRSGYGQFKAEINGKKEQYAHRISAYLYNGFDLASGLCICHKCDNPSCVNPSHLFAGTTKDNLQDMSKKGRHVCPNRKLDDLDRELAVFLRDCGVRNCDIAKHFNVSQSVAWYVSRGMRHNHVSQS